MLSVDNEEAFGILELLTEYVAKVTQDQQRYEMIVIRVFLEAGIRLVFDFGGTLGTM